MGEDVEELAQAGVFVLVGFVLGQVGGLIHAQLVGEIVAGVLLGNEVVAWLPYQDAVQLLGRVGLVLLVMEGGLSVDVTLLPRIGAPAVAIAVVGTALPVFLGWAFMRVLGLDNLEAVAAGAALSSTSIGMASKMLQQVQELHTPLGNLISVAAMVDDILSLVILAVLQQLERDDEDCTGSTGSTASPASGNATCTSDDSETTGWTVAQPVVVSAGFLVGGALLVEYFPRALQQPRLKAFFCKPLRKAAAVLLATGLLSVAAGYAGTTFLLGAFVAGIAFSRVEGSAEAVLTLKPLLDWLATVFFISIGLVIPVGDLFRGYAVGYGLLYTVPAFVGKAVTGYLAPQGQRWIVGMAMVARGELGFVMANEAFASGLMGTTSFVSCVWALLLCTVLSPPLMRWRLVKKRRMEQVEELAPSLLPESPARHLMTIV